MDVLLLCPNCGDPLRDVSADSLPDTAPFICDRDSRGWWGSELTTMARQNWDPATRSFKHGDVLRSLQEAVQEERDVRHGKWRRPDDPPRDRDDRIWVPNPPAPEEDPRPVDPFVPPEPAPPAPPPPKPKPSDPTPDKPNSGDEIK